MKNIIFLVAALIALCSASCTSSVTVTQRPDTWQAGAGTGALFDIVVKNTGSCPLNNIGLSITLPEGATINNYWNLQASTSYWLVTNYQDLLPVGNSVNTGMSINFPGAPSALSVTVYASSCPSSCSGAPTDGPTFAPTSAPTNGPTSAPVPCDIASSLRLGSAWTTDGVQYASYAIFLTNNGDCGMTDFVTSFALNGAEITQTWNLESALGGYAVKGFGSVLHAGDTYGGAGFNVKNAGNIQITPYGSACSC